MEITRRALMASSTLLIAPDLVTHAQAQQPVGEGTSVTAQTSKPKHINRAIELLEQGQPIYYTGSHSGTDGSFEQGKKDAH